MAISLTEMKAKQKASQVTWEDEIVDFAYHPAAFSVEVAQAVQEQAQKGDLAGVALAMEPLIGWWDVLDDDGERIAADIATIRQMPLGFLMSILSAVGDDMNPPERKG